MQTLPKQIPCQQPFCWEATAVLTEPRGHLILDTRTGTKFAEVSQLKTKQNIKEQENNIVNIAFTKRNIQIKNISINFHF